MSDDSLIEKIQIFYLLLVRYRLVERPGAQLVEAKEVAPPLNYYVWDHVGIALHVDNEVTAPPSDSPHTIKYPLTTDRC